MGYIIWASSGTYARRLFVTLLCQKFHRSSAEIKMSMKTIICPFCPYCPTFWGPPPKTRANRANGANRWFLYSFSASCLFSLNQKARNTSGQSPINEPYAYQLKQHPLVMYKGVHFMDSVKCSIGSLFRASNIGQSYLWVWFGTHLRSNWYQFLYRAFWSSPHQNFGTARA